MKVMSPKQAVAQWDNLLAAAQQGPVLIKEKGRKLAVMVSIEEAKAYERIKKEYGRKR